MGRFPGLSLTLGFFDCVQGFITDHERALEELFSENAEGSHKYNACLNTMATRISTVFASLRVCIYMLLANSCCLYIFICFFVLWWGMNKKCFYCTEEDGLINPRETGELVVPLAHWLDQMPDLKLTSKLRFTTHKVWWTRKPWVFIDCDVTMGC